MKKGVLMKAVLSTTFALLCCGLLSTVTSCNSTDSSNIKQADNNNNVGDKGPTGDKGEVGDKGPTGDAGTDGKDGVAGSKGETGDKGPTGDKGEVGDKGPTGDAGTDGKDGIDGSKGETGDFYFWVTLALNGGTLPLGYTDQFEVKQGETIPLEKIPELTRANYTFDGWFINNEQAFDESYVVMSNTLLVARWTYAPVMDNQHVVTLNLDGGTYDGDTTIIVDDNKTITLQNPSKTGYKFIGWYLGNEVFDFNTKITSNITLTAHYEKIKTFTITFNANGGKFVSGETSVTLNEGVSLSSLPTVSKEGYSFIGWYLEETKIEVGYIPTSDVTILAKWSVNPVVKYTVTLDAVDGKIENESLSTKSITYNENQVLGKLPNAVKDGFSFLGWYLNDNKVDESFKVTTNLTLTAKYEEIKLPSQANSATVEGKDNQIDLSWEKISGVTSYNVYYKKTGENEFKKIDSELVQASENRASIIGISAGSYQTKVVPVINNSEQVGLAMENVAINVSEYDKTGYAHFKAKENPGAYKEDGTLKDNAVVVYVNETNKNTVETTINGKTYNGLGNLLADAANINVPLDIVFTSQIASDQFKSLNKFSLYNEREGKYEILDGAITKLSTKGNTTDKRIDTNIDKNVVYREDGKGASSSYQNMMYVKNAKNITIEGVFGAGLYQWGLDFAECNSIEVRNLSFKDYPEDACCFESNAPDGTDEATYVQNYGNYFFHHNELYTGKANWVFESDKAEGDGGFDVKRCHSVTGSYNKFVGLHKSGLIGSSDSSISYNVTLHHNFYFGSSSRLPLGRQANIHLYNNYYYKSGTCQDIRANSYTFSENNFFYKCKEPQKLSSGAAIKSYNDVIYGSDSNKISRTIVSSRNENVSNSCAPIGIDFSRFDSDPDLFYATDVSSIKNFLNPNEIGRIIPEISGYTSSFRSELSPTEEDASDIKSTINDAYQADDISTLSPTTPIIVYKSEGDGKPNVAVKYSNCDFTFEGKTYSKALKMNSTKIGVMFRISKKMTLNAVVAGTDVNINGTNYEINNNKLTLTLDPGEYEISMGTDTALLLYAISLK